MLKELVSLKCYPNGITVQLDDLVSFDDIVTALEQKCLDSSKFFGTSKTAISFDGRILSELEEEKLLDVMRKSTNLEIVCVIASKNSPKNQEFLNAIYQTPMVEKSNQIKFYRGNLLEGQILEADSSILIIGNVVKGSTVISTGDIIILGGLYGEVYAGIDAADSHFIFSMECFPERMEIGKLKYKPKKVSKWSAKAKADSQIAYICKDKVVTEQATKELLDKIIF